MGMTQERWPSEKRIAAIALSCRHRTIESKSVRIFVGVTELQDVDGAGRERSVGTIPEDTCRHVIIRHQEDAQLCALGVKRDGLANGSCGQQPAVELESDRRVRREPAVATIAIESLSWGRFKRSYPQRPRTSAIFGPQVASEQPDAASTAAQQISCPYRPKVVRVSFSP